MILVTKLKNFLKIVKSHYVPFSDNGDRKGKKFISVKGQFLTYQKLSLVKVK